MSYISSKLPFTGYTKMVKYDSGFSTLQRTNDQKQREYLVVMVIYPIFSVPNQGS